MRGSARAPLSDENKEAPVSKRVLQNLGVDRASPRTEGLADEQGGFALDYGEIEELQKQYGPEPDEPQAVRPEEERLMTFLRLGARRPATGLAPSGCWAATRGCPTRT